MFAYRQDGGDGDAIVARNETGRDLAAPSRIPSRLCVAYRVWQMLQKSVVSGHPEALPELPGP